MKKIQMLMLAAVTGLTLVACGGGSEGSVQDEHSAPDETISQSTETTYTIDPNSSVMFWKGEMMGMYSHEGTLNIISGTITTENGNIIEGNIEVDMLSITPTDENYGEDNPKEKLVGHLSSADFFDTQNHSTASLTVTSIQENTGNADLTIRDITNSEEISEIRMNEKDGTLEVKANLTFDRTKYDVNFKHPMEEMVVSDNVEVTVKLSANAQ